MSKNCASKNANQVGGILYSEIQKTIYETSKYFSEAFALKCFPDLMSLGLFPNIKELTESMAAFSHIEKFAKIKHDTSYLFCGNKKILMFDVCCGSTPRTGALFAFRTSWNCFSIDPRVNEKWTGNNKIKRLTTIKSKIEDIETVESNDPIVITNVHGHVDASIILEKLRSPVIVLLSMPCCKSIYPVRGGDYSKEDLGIWSPKRTVRIDLILGKKYE